MVSIGIGSATAKAWWPDNAVMALDFCNNRYMRDRQVVDRSTVMSFARASTKLARNRAGLLLNFATDIPAITDAGLSVEPAATNSGLYSSQFDNAWWSKDSATVTPNAILAPDGTMTADKVTPSGAGDVTHGVYKSSLAPYLTQRVFAKAGELHWLAVRQGGVDAWFNLADGTIGTVGGFRTASIEPYANGWYLCQVFNTAAPNAGYTYRVSVADNTPNFIADGTSGLYLWNSEARAGGHPLSSSPIQTEAGAATRAADVADLHLPPGSFTMLVTFDDGSTQSVSGISGDYRLPTDLARPAIRSIAVSP